MKRKILKILGIILGILLLALAGILIWAYAPDKSVEELKEKYAYDNSQFVEVDGLNVHYRINGEGFPVVLIHGTAASLHTWEGWTKVLKDNFKVISLDLPAFGLIHSNATGNYSLDYYSDFLEAFLTKIGVDTFALAGNSLGGAIAWRYTTKFPQKVKKMILIDAAGYPFKKTPSLPFKLAKSPFWSKIMLHFTPKPLLKKSILEVFSQDDKVTDELVNRYYDLSLREGNRKAFIDRVRNEKYTNPELIKGIKTPTLILWGEGDVWIPLENAYQFEKDIENSKLIIYENAGHIPMEEIPMPTVLDAREFLIN